MSLRTVVIRIALPAGIFACSAADNSEVTARTSAALSVSGEIKSQDGLCLDVLDNRQISGAAVDPATCNGTTAQTFTWDAGTPGPIKNTASGLCLDDVWGGGAVLQMATCMGTPEQTWTVQGSPENAAIVDGYYHCVDILGNQQVNGQTVDPATCNGSGAQVWLFDPPCAESVALQLNGRGQHFTLGHERHRPLRGVLYGGKLAQRVRPPGERARRRQRARRRCRASQPSPPTRPCPATGRAREGRDAR